MLFEMIATFVAESVAEAGLGAAQDSARAKRQRVRSSLRVVEGQLSGFYRADWRGGDVEVGVGELRLDELRLRPSQISATPARRAGLFEAIPAGEVYRLKVDGATLEWALPDGKYERVRAWLRGETG